jgi:hypothetical protein
LIDVGDTVGVGVAFLCSAEAPVDGVADAEHDGGQQRGY